MYPGAASWDPGSPTPSAFQTHQAMGVWAWVRDSMGEPYKARVHQGMGGLGQKSLETAPPPLLQGQDSGSESNHQLEGDIVETAGERGDEEGDQHQRSRRQSSFPAEGGSTCCVGDACTFQRCLRMQVSLL